MPTNLTTERLSDRINELGNKSGQILLFLSFAMVSVATLKAAAPQGTEVGALNCAFFWWKLALFPILIGILPMKEAWWDQRWWYSIIRWLRFGLLWVAVFLIAGGALAFLWAT